MKESINDNDLRINEHEEQKRSSRDSPWQELVKHVRVRLLIECDRDDVHNEHSDQSLQQDQLPFNERWQEKHERFSISFPWQRLPKQVRRRVSMEPGIPQAG